MFYSRTNSNRQEVNLNTNFFNSYSDTCHVQVGGWNQQLSVKFKPCVGTDANGIRTYAEDKSQIVSTSITNENALALIEGFEATVLPAIRGEKESGTVSIVMGSDDNRKVLTVGYKDGNAFISISIGLNEVGAAQQTITHTFNKKNYLEEYDPATGNAPEKSVEVELFSFMNKVRKVDDLIPVQAHSNRYYDMVRPVGSGGQSNTGFNNQRSAPQQNSGYQAPTTTASDMDFLGL